MLKDNTKEDVIVRNSKTYPVEKWKFDIPILIPSLKRYTKHKKTTMVVDACLDNLFKFYECTQVNVLGQEYTEEDKKYLEDKFTDKNVNFRWHEKRLGIIKTFNELKIWGVESGDFYVHYDDDVKMSQQFDDNPTLLAMKSVMMQNPDRIGIVTVPSISIHHFAKNAKKLVNVHSNPAQLVLINSKPAKNCTYDPDFENFRSDTDFTMQMANQGYFPVIISRFFSFMHTIPLSKIEYNENGGRKFKVLDNVNESKGSAGGDRRMEMKKHEFDLFVKKWPLVRTVGNYRQQILKTSVKSLTNFTDAELVGFQDNFDTSLIRNPHYEYYGEEALSYFENSALFG